MGVLSVMFGVIPFVYFFSISNVSRAQSVSMSRKAAFALLDMMIFSFHMVLFRKRTVRKSLGSFSLATLWYREQSSIIVSRQGSSFGAVS